MATAYDGAAIAPGQAWVAPPDHHLVIEGGRVGLTRGPRENRNRPAIDTLFRSVAIAYGPRVIGTVLTGTLDDGTAGLWAVKRAGGIALVQHPDDAEFPCMPRNALEGVSVDHCLPLDQLAPLLVRLVDEPSGRQEAVGDLQGTPVAGPVFVCPDCSGPLQEVRAPGEPVVRFRCHVGHAVTLMNLLAAHEEAREAALWAATRTLEHEAALCERRALQCPEQGPAAGALAAKAAEARRTAQQLRAMLDNAAGAPLAGVARG